MCTFTWSERMTVFKYNFFIFVSLFSSMKNKSFTIIVAICTFLCHWTAFGYGGGVFMKEIILTQGQVALVDDEDFDFLNQWKWYASKVKNTYYAQRQIGGRDNKTTIHMHRLIMNLDNKTLFVDHEDTHGLNNQKYNLRIATHKQNTYNKRKTNGISIYKGVYFDKRRGTWNAGIKINYKSTYLGVFPSELEAAKAYNQAAIKHHGKFARINEI